MNKINLTINPAETRIYVVGEERKVALEGIVSLHGRDLTRGMVDLAQGIKISYKPD